MSEPEPEAVDDPSAAAHADDVHEADDRATQDAVPDGPLFDDTTTQGGSE